MFKEVTTMPLDNLNQFTGTEHYYRFRFDPTVLLTDGAKHVADEAGAYWLMEAIAGHQPALRRHPDDRLRALQFWTLTVHPDRSATLTCVADSDEPPAVIQRIPFTDFPLPEVRLWVGHSDGRAVIYLPSEH